MFHNFWHKSNPIYHLLYSGNSRELIMIILTFFYPLIFHTVELFITLSDKVIVVSVLNVHATIIIMLFTGVKGEPSSF